MRGFAFLLLIAFFLAAPVTQAQSSRHGSKHGAPPTPTPSPTATPSSSATPNPKANSNTESQNGEKTIEETFGPASGAGNAGCKIDELARSSIDSLKADCNAWIKGQKSDLKAHFLTGACKEKCDDCGMSLKRCAVTGSVHYTVK
jgi:hypothetical protein